MGKGVYDTNSPHFKGTFLTIYAVNQKYPAGGVAGDWCLINGWAHYWDADRGTWCVNSQRDTYWDELFSGVKFNTENIMKKYEYLLFDLSKKANTSDVQASLEELKKEIGDRTVVEGNVTNLPDEEDITSGINESGTDVLSLKDRVYNPLSFSGKGYKILRKNIKPVSLAVTKIIVGSIPTVDGAIVFTINGVEVSVDMVTTTMTSTDLVAQKIAEKLTETMTEYEVSKDASTITLTRKFGGVISTPSSFSAVNTGISCSITDSTKKELRNILTPIMMNQPNTIYVIRYDFDLNGETIEMQEGCTLKFEGGSLHNGIVKGNNTHIAESKVKLFDNIILRGTFDVPYLYYDNFGVIADAEDNNNADIINKTNGFIKNTNVNTLTFASSLYYINKQIAIELNPREETLNIIGYSVTIKATEDFSEDYLLRINYTSFATTTRTIIKGLTLNCNVLTGGINIPNGNCIKIHNIAIINVGVNKKGILIKSGNELHFANSRITGNNKGKCFGICFHTSDCSADNIVMLDVVVAIYQSGSANHYSNIHPWISSPQLFHGSTFLLIGGGAAYLDRCACDTYQYGVYSINNPYISFTNSVFFQNTNVVTASGETSALIIIAENLKAFYSFTGCNMPSFDFQHFSNNDTEIKKYCNFIGSNILGTYYPFTGIKEIPYAKYDDYSGVYIDGILSSNTLRAIPKQISASNGHLFRFFNINNWMGQSYNFFCEWYGKPIFFMVSCLNGNIRVRSIFGNPPVKFYTKDGLFYIYCPKVENTPYNVLLAVGAFGLTDMGEKTPDDSYTEITCDKIIGNSTERPSKVSEGYEYYDNTLKKKILWNGTAWVNMDGTELEASTLNEQGAENPS